MLLKSLLLISRDLEGQVRSLVLFLVHELLSSISHKPKVSQGKGDEVLNMVVPGQYKRFHCEFSGEFRILDDFQMEQ